MRTVNLDELGRHFVEGDFALIYEATTYEFQQFVSFEDFQQGCYTYQLGITSMNKLFEKEWCGLTYAMWVDDREEKSIQLAYDAQKQITSFALKPYITDDMDEQWTQNRYRMQICDEWLVFWGGTNELENYHYAYENQRYAYDLVCTEQDAGSLFRLVACNDIIAFKHSPVVSLQVSFLLNDGASVLLELVHYPCTAFVMCVAVHRSWSEVTLLLTEEISGVGIELRSYSNHCLCVVVCFLCALA